MTTNTENTDTTTSDTTSDKNTIIYSLVGTCFLEIISPTYGTQYVRIDPEDVELIQAHKWYVNRDPKRREGHQLQVVTKVPATGGKRTTLYLHRYLLGPAPFQGAQVDHVDGSPLHNRRENLRWVTHQQNQQNQVGARGYYWNKLFNKWQARIRVDGRQIHLGYFATEQEARAAYQAAKLVHHNLPPGRRAALSSSAG
jgi:hypothetical protein